MTYQRDPDGRRRPSDYVRRDDGTWSVGTVFAGLAILGVVAFLIFSFAGDRTGDPVTPRSPGATAPTTTTPQPAPPATTPKQ